VNSRLKAGEHGPHQNTGVNSRLKAGEHGPHQNTGMNSRLKAGEHGPHQNTGVNSREGKVVHAFNKTPDVLLIVNAGRIGAGNREKTQSTSKEN
jgi:hypothetical protein